MARNSLWDDEEDIAPAMIPAIIVDDHVAVWTGLYDARGEALYREPEAMGFHHPLE